MDIYERAEKNGFIYEFCCADITPRKYDSIFDEAKVADKRKVTKIAIQAGIISAFEAKFWNPYKCHKTDEYLIYTHSAIDYFIKVR